MVNNDIVKADLRKHKEERMAPTLEELEKFREAKEQGVIEAEQFEELKQRFEEAKEAEKDAFGVGV